MIHFLGRGVSPVRASALIISCEMILPHISQNAELVDDRLDRRQSFSTY